MTIRIDPRITEYQRLVVETAAKFYVSFVESRERFDPGNVNLTEAMNDAVEEAVLLIDQVVEGTAYETKKEVKEDRRARTLRN